MRRISISLVLVFAWTLNCLAHDPNTATIDFQNVSEGAYILHMRTPLVHLDKALRSRSRDGGKLVYGSKAYKLALVGYVKNSISLTATIKDAQGGVRVVPVIIKDTALKLGSHETSIILQLGGLDAPLSSLALTAPLMSQNPDQKTLFRFIDGKRIEKVFLDKSNDFSGSINFSD